MSKRGQLLEQYFNIESTWDNLICSHYPNPDGFYSWFMHHRVLKCDNKIVKLQYLGEGSLIPSSQTVIEEFKILKKAEGAVCRLEPKLVEIEPNWFALELNYFDGVFLSEILYSQGRKLRLFWELLVNVLKLSLKGVMHPQLRARHILIRNDGGMALIDYGGGKITHFHKAFFSNFGFYNWRNSPLLYVLKNLLSPSETTKKNLLKKPKVLQTININAFNRSDIPENTIALKEVLGFEETLIAQLNKDITIYPEVPTLILGPMSIHGNEPWEIIRRSVFTQVDFENKKILIIGSVIGLAAVFAEDAGANIIGVYEKNEALVLIANQLIKLFTDKPIEVTNISNNYPTVDIVLCLNKSSDSNEQIERLKRFKDVSELVIRSSLTKIDLIKHIDPKKQIDILLKDKFSIYRISNK